MWPDLKKKPSFHTHNIKLTIFTRNGLLAQYTIIFHCVPCSKVMSLVSVAAFLRPCVSLEWHFGAIKWSWLSCIGAWRVGQATKGWPMSVIFNLKCCEHKEGPVGPQIGLLTFNYLRITFCTPILSPVSAPTHITTTCNIITVIKKVLKAAWVSGVWKLFTHTIIAKKCLL